MERSNKPSTIAARVFVPKSKASKAIPGKNFPRDTEESESDARVGHDQKQSTKYGREKQRECIKNPRPSSSHCKYVNKIVEKECPNDDEGLYGCNCEIFHSNIIKAIDGAGNTERWFRWNDLPK